jgi:hypothetical protein
MFWRSVCRPDGKACVTVPSDLLLCLADSGARIIATSPYQEIDPGACLNAISGLNGALWPATRIHVSKALLTVTERRCYVVTKPEPPCYYNVCSHSHCNNWDSGFLIYSKLWDSSAHEGTFLRLAEREGLLALRARPCGVAASGGALRSCAACRTRPIEYRGFESAGYQP